MTEGGKRKSLVGGETESHLLDLSELLHILSAVFLLSVDRTEGNLDIKHTKETTQDMHLKRRNESGLEDEDQQEGIEGENVRE